MDKAFAPTRSTQEAVLEDANPPLGLSLPVRQFYEPLFQRLLVQAGNTLQADRMVDCRLRDLFPARSGPGRMSTPPQRTGTATSPVMRFTENVSPSTRQLAVSPPEKVTTAVCSPTTTVSVPSVG